MSLVALSELLGATVRDASGTVRGRVREAAVAPQEHPTRIAFLIVNTPEGERVLPASSLKSSGSTVRAVDSSTDWEKYSASDGVLLLSHCEGCEAEIPEALYESGKQQLSMRVPSDPAQQFPAVVRAADVLLAVLREADEDVAEAAA